MQYRQSGLRRLYLNGEAIVIRNLRLRLLEEYRQRGKLIVKANRTNADAVRAHGIDSHEEWLCVQLYRRWGDFCRAERWNVIRGGETPDSVANALTLILDWESHHDMTMRRV